MTKSNKKVQRARVMIARIVISLLVLVPVGAAIFYFSLKAYDHRVMEGLPVLFQNGFLVTMQVMGIMFFEFITSAIGVTLIAGGFIAAYKNYQNLKKLR